MEFTKKQLLEQAWALQNNLERLLKTGYPIYIGRSKNNLPLDKRQKLYKCHIRAHYRYLRRLKKFWT